MDKINNKPTKTDYNKDKIMKQSNKRLILIKEQLKLAEEIVGKGKHSMAKFDEVLKEMVSKSKWV